MVSVCVCVSACAGLFVDVCVCVCHPLYNSEICKFVQRNILNSTLMC